MKIIHPIMIVIFSAAAFYHIGSGLATNGPDGLILMGKGTILCFCAVYIKWLQDWQVEQ